MRDHRRSRFAPHFQRSGCASVRPTTATDNRSTAAAAVAAVRGRTLEKAQRSIVEALGKGSDSESGAATVGLALTQSAATFQLSMMQLQSQFDCAALPAWTALT